MSSTWHPHQLHTHNVRPFAHCSPRVELEFLVALSGPHSLSRRHLYGSTAAGSPCCSYNSVFPFWSSSLAASAQSAAALALKKNIFSFRKTFISGVIQGLLLEKLLRFVVFRTQKQMFSPTKNNPLFEWSMNKKHSDWIFKNTKQAQLSKNSRRLLHCGRSSVSSQKSQGSFFLFSSGKKGKTHQEKDQKTHGASK